MHLLFLFTPAKSSWDDFDCLHVTSVVIRRPFHSLQRSSSPARIERELAFDSDTFGEGPSSPRIVSSVSMCCRGFSILKCSYRYTVRD